MAATKYENFITGDDTRAYTDSGRYNAQTFTTITATHTVSSVKILIYRDANFAATTTVSIQGVDDSDLPDDTNVLATSNTVAAATIGTADTGTWIEFTFNTPPTIRLGTKYAIVIKPGTSSYDLYWRYDSANGYAGGKQCLRNTGTWEHEGTGITDALFEVWGTTDVYIPSDKTYSKKLVAIAGNQIFYEAAAGTMSVFSAATDDIDVGVPLTVVEAFQKLFIANQTNLKVMDFINTKLTTTSAPTNNPDPGNILTGDDSAASMIVDYVAPDAKTIYGKRTTAATFQAEKISSTNDAGADIDFTTSIVETAPPHWYNWTVFGNVADSDKYGTMPDSAYLVCRYRGRLVLSGNPDYPHQWYMSKVGFPFNFLYGTNDPMSAVAGTNADAGELGDIVRALIPFGDDYLIFACANSIHLLDGDPVSGGSIDELDDKTGIFGPWAWCKDGLGNLWFYGTGGLYKMAGGRTKPVNISQSHIPQLVTKWGAVPGTHRVVLTYDPFRNGVIISRTTLADGTNLNYYYDFKTEGFYPETYPTACGIFSSAYYDSDTAATKGLVLGCNDGYIRNFYDADKDDDTGASSTSEISSYVTWPIEHLAEDNDSEGKLTSLTVELAGGGGGGDFSDTDGVSYALYRGNDAESVLEKIKPASAWATAIDYIIGDIVTYSSIEYVCIVTHTSNSGASTHQEPDTNTTDWEGAIFTSGTLTGTGRKARIRTRVRGAWLGLKFYNSTASETWAINRVFGEIKPSGKIK